MKPILLLATAVLTAAGCATTADNAQYAQADCKVAPLRVGKLSGVSKPTPVSSIDQRLAEMQLASNNYRFRALARNGYDNSIEDALRDCDRAALSNP